MNVDPWPNLALPITRRRWRCVPDPLLCLSGSGAAFLQGLALHAEVWLTPELLNILDHWPMYDRDPGLLGFPGAEGTRDALRIWSGLRNEAGHVSGPLCWVSDALRESRLPAGIGEGIVSRWEEMAEALDERLSTAAEASGNGLTRENGASAFVAFDPSPVWRLELGYTRSVTFDLNSFAFDLRMNVGRLLRPKKTS